MTVAKVFTIAEKLRSPESAALVNLHRDFVLSPLASIPLDQVRGDPSLELWGLDRRSSSVVLLRQAPTVQSAPFLYQQQFLNATEAVLVDYRSFVEMMSNVEVPIERLAFVYSTGRCGSTLVHQLVAASGAAVSLNEPDVYSHAEREVAAGRIEATLLAELLLSATKYLVVRHLRESSLVVVKLRSRVIHIYEQLSAALGAARRIFLYRNAIDFVQSWDRIYNRHWPRQWILDVPLLRDLARALSRSYARRLNPALDKRYRHELQGCTPGDVYLKCGWSAMWVLEWLDRVNWYAHHAQDDAGVRALRYEDLVSAPDAVHHLFRHLGLSQGSVDSAMHAFSRHSQAGHAFAESAKGRPLSRTTRRLIAEVLEKHTRHGSPHVVLNRTLRVQSPPPAAGVTGTMSP
jgi:hypothetical protein